ncbi:MAG: hypothetical protein VKJ06_07200 [Vampirovibrionales bacterium]|nr:hypothetical protein [Vampirovibrionales bacterium]
MMSGLNINSMMLPMGGAMMPQRPESIGLSPMGPSFGMPALDGGGFGAAAMGGGLSASFGSGFGGSAMPSVMAGLPPMGMGGGMSMPPMGTPLHGGAQGSQIEKLLGVVLILLDQLISKASPVVADSASVGDKACATGESQKGGSCGKGKSKSAKAHAPGQVKKSDTKSEKSNTGKTNNTENTASTAMDKIIDLLTKIADRLPGTSDSKTTPAAKSGSDD